MSTIRTRWSVAGAAAVLVMAASTLTPAMAGADAGRSAASTVSPADFGGVGDGMTDDAAALQAALDSGRVVDLGDRAWRTGSALTLRSGGGFTGDAGGGLILEGDVAVIGDAVEGVSIRDITISRSAQPQTATGSAIRIFVSSDIQIRGIDLLAHNGLGPAIYLAGRYDDTTDATPCHDVRIDDNVIADYQRVDRDASGRITQVKGTGIAVSHCRDVSITRNVVTQSPILDVSEQWVNYQGAGIAVISTIDADVSRNSIHRAGQGIDIGGGKNFPGRTAADLAQTTLEGYRGTRDSRFERNEIVDIYGPGIKLVNDARDNVVSRNVIDGAGLAGIWITAGTTAVADRASTRGNVISRNEIRDAGMEPYATAWRNGFDPGANVGAGIMFEGAFDFFDTSFDARPTDNLVERNVIDAGDGSMPWGVSDRHALPGPPEAGTLLLAAGNTVTRNTVTGASVAAFDIDPARNTLR